MDREIPHSLDEDFTFKRPLAFVLDGRATAGVTTWQRLYELICRRLIQRDEALFRSLVDHPDFISNRGKHTITTHPADTAAFDGYAANAPPVFVRHYWLTGVPRPLAANVACLDYSVAKGGKLVACRWDGESVLSAEKFWWNEKQHDASSP